MSVYLPAIDDKELFFSEARDHSFSFKLLLGDGYSHETNIYTLIGDRRFGQEKICHMKISRTTSCTKKGQSIFVLE